MKQKQNVRDTNVTKRSRGGNVKQSAPEGFYTAAQAQKVLGLIPSTFSYYVRKGRINRYVPPLKKEGYYKKEEIDDLATQIALFMHTVETPTSRPPSVTRTARPEDADGVVSVLTNMGWRTATAEQRRGFYAANPYVDYVVIANDQVMGYINAAPYVPDVMESMLAGKMRSWQVTPADIMAYESGKTYDLYVGIATRKDIPEHTQRFGFRLISGFMAFLGDLAQQRIYIHSLYAASDQPDGIKLCKDLGFDLLPKEEGDLFNRYRLDLQTSKSLFAKRYRAVLRSQSK